MNRIFLLLGLWMIMGCSSQLDSELPSKSNDTDFESVQEDMKQQIKEVEATVKALKPPSQKILTHHVYFNLKDDLTDKQKQSFEKGLKSLSKIEVAKNLKVGKSANTGDKRLVSNYDYVLTMHFESMEDLKTYANDEFHLKVRGEIGPMLAKAPIVYDAWVE